MSNMSNHTKTIVIVGATGNQGSSIAKTFLDLPGWHVRGLTRDSTRPSAKKLASDGAEMINADMDDPQTLVNAFRGANVIYGFTDFWLLAKSPDLPNLLATKYKGLTIGQACFEHELQHGRNIVSAAEQVLLEENRLEHFILSTASHARVQSKGHIQQLLHFDVKAAIEAYLHKEYPKLTHVTSYLIPGFFTNNLTLFPFLQPRKQADGKFIFSWPCVSPKTILPVIDPANDTGFFVEALLKQPIGTRLLGVSDTVSIQQIVDAWAQATNTNAEFVTMDKDKAEQELEKGLPGFGREMVENMEYYALFGYTGGDETIKPPQALGISTSHLASYETFIMKQDWSSVVKT